MGFAKYTTKVAKYTTKIAVRRKKGFAKYTMIHDKKPYKMKKIECMTVVKYTIGFAQYIYENLDL